MSGLKKGKGVLLNNMFKGGEGTLASSLYPPSHATAWVPEKCGIIKDDKVPSFSSKTVWVGMPWYKAGVIYYRKVPDMDPRKILLTMK